MNSNNPIRGFLRNMLLSYHEQNSSDARQHQEEYNEEKNHRIKELKINRNSLIVNAIMVFITFVVLFLTYYQARISYDAVKVATDALQHQKISDSLNGIKESEKYELQMKSVQAQIAALNAAKFQFERQHENFLEVFDLEIDFSDKSKKPIIKYKFSNHGSTIQIKAHNIMYGLTREPNSNVLKKQLSSELQKSSLLPFTAYISEKLNRPMADSFDISPLTFEEYTNEPFVFIMVGKVKYLNLINNKMHIMEYCLKTKYINLVSYEILELSNSRYN